VLRNFGVRHFGGPDDKESGHSGVKIPKSRVTTGFWRGISGFRHFGCREAEEAVFWDREFRTPGTRKPEITWVVGSNEGL
jgi:hypothetical protein